MSENKFERFLDERFRLGSSETLKFKFFHPVMPTIILRVLGSALRGLTRNIRVNMSVLLEVCLHYLSMDSMPFEINAAVHETFISNKCELLCLLNAALNKSELTKYALYGFMAKIGNQIVFRSRERFFLLEILKFLRINIAKFPRRFYYNL
jgi:hypothetical protein